MKPPQSIEHLHSAARFRLRALWQGQIAPAARRWSNSGRDFTPFFIAGAMGSGTTLLAVALGLRFEVAGVVTESERQISRRSPLWVDATKRFPSVGAYLQAIETVDAAPEDMRADLLDLYRSRAAYPGDRILDKGPNTNLVRAELLSQLYPDAPFVLIFRDPVSNIEGFRRKWSSFGNDTLGESIRFYREIHERFLLAAESRGFELHVIEYESLVDQLDETLGELADVLGLRRCATPRPIEDRPAAGVRGIRRVEGGRIQVEPNATARSTASLRPAEVAEIRSELGDLHSRLRRLAHTAPTFAVGKRGGVRSQQGRNQVG